MSKRFDMADYVPVNERIEAFGKEFPDGSLQAEIVELTDSRVTMKAYAYRFPEDTRPGIGHSSLEIPGATPYTKGSEIENAETSAWGRAIAALGFEVKRGVASREEVANKQPASVGVTTQGSPTPAGQGRDVPVSVREVARPVPDKRQVLAELAAEKKLGIKAIEEYATVLGFPSGERLNDEQMDQLIEAVRGHNTDQPLVLNLEPPKPGTEDYKRLPATAKASARAFWAQKETPV